MPRNALPAVPPESELLRALVDKVSAILAYWDSDLRCRFANRAYERWFGVSPESLIGKHVSELLGPMYPLNLPYIEGALRGEAQEFEREIPDPSGGPSRHALAHYIPDIADGAVRGFFVLASDISAIKRAELLLRESQERFELAVEGADLASWDWNVQTGEVIFNRRWAEMRGFRPEEVRPHVDSWLSGLHPEDVGRVQQTLVDHFEGRSSGYAIEHRVRAKSGQWIWILDQGKVFARDAEGRPLRMVGTELDITERKRLEHAQDFLAEVGPILATTLDYEETLARIAELAVRDLADLCIVDIVENGVEMRLKVTSRDPSKAWVCQALMKVPLDRRRPHLMHAVFETGNAVLMPSVSEEAIASFAQSEERHRALRAADIRSLMAVPLVAHSRLLGAIAFASSTSSRVYGSADLRLAEELARRAALSIENARLYRAAQRATQARDDILGIVAHDLRNPLNTIILQTGMLRLRRPQAESQSDKAAERIERAARRMNRLIQDLLDVSRMEAGRLSVSPACISACQVLYEAIEAEKSLATEASLELRLDIPAELPDVWADHDRLLQVFENLVGNALKFTDPGGRITVGAAPRDGEVLFWVTDTGGGIAAEHLPHLFDRFWQAGKAERSGAGLGLPIVKGVIDAHHGRIWVESTLGHGSTFFFTIPVAHLAEAWRAEPAPHAP